MTKMLLVPLFKRVNTTKNTQVKNSKCVLVAHLNNSIYIMWHIELLQTQYLDYNSGWQIE